MTDMLDLSLPSSSARQPPRADEARSRLPGELIAIALLTAALLALFLPLAYSFGRITDPAQDHMVHEAFARSLWETGDLPTAHFLYHGLVIGLRDLSGGNWRLATALAMSLPHIALGLIAYALARLITGGAGWRRRGLCALAAITLTLAVPPFALGGLLTGRWLTWYLVGYLTPTVYHNPTYTLLRPLALLLAALCLAALLPRERRPWGRALLLTGVLAVLTALNVAAKPNFVLILLPVLGLWTLYRLARRQPIAWLPLIAGIGVPALAALYWQYDFTYAAVSGQLSDSRLTIAPLLALQEMTGQGPGALAIYALVSAAVPALIYLLGGRAARADVGFNLGWLLFGVGAGYTYLLAETGERLDNANFVWSAYSGALLLYGAALAFALRAAVGRIAIVGRRRFLIGAGVGAAIVLAHGLIYYAAFIVILNRHAG